MMKGMPNWMPRTRRALSFIIVCVCLLVRSACGQSGFVSIACCAKSDFTDNTTSIIWTSDLTWYSDNSSCINIIRAAANDPSYEVRTFHIDSGKRCYNLTTTKNQDYLIRGTFPLGDPVGSRESSFDVLIGVTPIGVVNSSKDLVVEGIFRASDQFIDFCLEHENGVLYISQLELRPLSETEYLQGNASKVLKLVSRVDLGSNESITRYPDDLNDRIWRSLDNSTVILPQDLQPIINSSTISNINTTVPLKVLKTALTHTDRLEFWHKNLDLRDNNYTLILYFLELNDTVKPGQRQFNLYINNVTQSENFDVFANGSKYREVALNVIANSSLNFTLVKVPSKYPFGPILNAYEILQVLPWYEGTNQQDVDLIANVREELLNRNRDNEMLKSWSGDPCLPQPWPGLECNNTSGISLITKLDISARKLHGPIPTNIANLTYLKELNLSYNKFTDQIPQFPATSVLTSVDLSHNDLTGSLPESLISLPDLTKLYFGCNLNLSGKPSSFNRPRLSTDYGGCAVPGQRSKTQKLVISTIACGSFLVTVVVGIALVRICRQRLVSRSKLAGKQQPMTKNAVFAIPSMDDVIFKSINIETYTLVDIEKATHKYKTLIGEGGFGSVFRGTLPDGQEVAVKVRSSTSTQGTREFENELNLLSAIRHENLVPLLGYCSENDQQILVYPFMSNGSLQDRLYGEAAKRKTLDWPTRLSIALGAARGLTHLHTFAGRCIIHRDVKSSNILLDHSMNAKVADFGFSKYAPQEGDSGASLEVRGTAGYLDPEYYSTQHLSAKSDVFSFGVVLLEIVSSREPLNIHRPRNEWSLVEWAKPYLRESKIDEIVDPSIKGMYHAEAMWRVVEVALACIEPFSAYRPSMADIVRELEDALIIENNASEYMKSIDSMYSLGGSNRYSIVIDKKTVLPPPAPTPTEPSPYNTQALAPPEPR